MHKEADMAVVVILRCIIDWDRLSTGINTKRKGYPKGLLKMQEAKAQLAAHRTSQECKTKS